MIVEEDAGKKYTTTMEVLPQGNCNNWSIIYDKYAAVMYGNILAIINNKAMAELIFIKAFERLKADNDIIPVHCSTAVFLSIYAKKFAGQYISEDKVIDN